MKTLKRLALIALLAGCRPAAAPVNSPESATVPILHASEGQDEWLYGHCTYVGLLDTTNEAAPAQAASRGASLGEVVYEDGTSWHVSLFACRPNPPWAGGPAQTEPSAGEKAASPADEKATPPDVAKVEQPIADKTEQPSADKAAQPRADKAAQPGAAKATQPVAGKATQPAGEKGTRRTGEKSARPTNEKSARPANEKGARPANGKKAPLPAPIPGAQWM